MSAMDITTLAAVGIVTAAGLVRGTTGFGGAMLMTPVLSALLGPIPAVVTALLMETAAALVMFPDALPKARWRTLLYLILPAVVTVPLGGYFFLTVDPAVARKMISAVVIVFSLMLLLGFRYSGSPRVITSLALGSVVGALLGATSVGAPPVILYLMSGPDPVAVTRANLTLFVTAISVIGLIMLAAAGAIGGSLATSAMLLVVPFLLATWLGGQLFARLSDAGARRFALVLMLCLGTASIFL
ncbi:MAG: sulfite exporter TauE/SafE family protein [Pseudolabrys sp.]